MIKKFVVSFSAFVLMLLLGVVSFNFYYASEKLKMIQVVKEFHNAQMSNNTLVIDELLTDNFTESGARRFVQTPEVIYKTDITNFDYSKIDFEIEAKYSFILNILSNDTESLSFVRELKFPPEDNGKAFSLSYYVTYTFEKTENGLKISKVERNL